MLLDAYGPGLTDNVQRLCWKKGYIVVTHGGGASMVCQTNDVAHHKDVRKDFIDLQTEALVHKARGQGGGLVDLTPEENISIMNQVMANIDLHLKASRAYKYTGTTNAFDGSEDHLITGDAKVFWDEHGMRQQIDEAVNDIEERWQAGILPWGLKTVMSLIQPYPERCEMDEWRPGMEDEATEDPDGVPWSVDEAGASAAEDALDDNIIDFDTLDWVDHHWAAAHHRPR